MLSTLKFMLSTSTSINSLKKYCNINQSKNEFRNLIPTKPLESTQATQIYMI